MSETTEIKNPATRRQIAREIADQLTNDELLQQEVIPLLRLDYYSLIERIRELKDELAKSQIRNGRLHVKIEELGEVIKLVRADVSRSSEG